MSNEGLSFIPAQVTKPTSLPQEVEGKSCSIAGHRAGKQFLGSKVDESPAVLQETSAKVGTLSEKIPKPPTRPLPPLPTSSRPPIPTKPLPPTPSQSRDTILAMPASSPPLRTAPPIPDRATKPALRSREEIVLSRKIGFMREPPPKVTQVVGRSTLSLSNAEIVDNLKYVLKSDNDKLLSAFSRFLGTTMTPQREGVKQEFLPMLRDELNARVKEGKISESQIPPQVKQFLEANQTQTGKAPSRPARNSLHTSDKSAQLHSLKTLTSDHIQEQRKQGLLSTKTQMSEKMNLLFKEKNFKEVIKFVFEKPSEKGLTATEFLNAYKLKMTSAELFEGIKGRLEDPGASLEEKKALLEFSANWMTSKTFAEDQPAIKEQLKDIAAFAEVQPDLKVGAEKLAEALNAKPLAVPSETRLKEAKPIDLNRIKKGYPKDLPGKFADALANQSQLVRQKLDVGELLTKKLEDPESAPIFAAYAAQSNAISYTISHQIVSEADPKKRAKLMSFYAEVAKQATLKGDYNTAFAIYVAFNKSEVSRLKKSEALLNKQTKQMIADLTELFNGNGNYRNLAVAMSTHPAPIPPAFRLGNLLSGARENPSILDQLKMVSQVLTPLVAAKQLPPTHLDANQKNIIKMFDLDVMKTPQFEEFVKAAETKAKAQIDKAKDDLEKASAKAATEEEKAQIESQRASLPEYKPKSSREHLDNYLYELSLTTEPRKKV
ncbi:MAG: hypothetical protein CK425_01630 [Parachlamydia sp.]|nr:MAG: hypothetical protein CK425_01630 [Parachlamydia sp.]